MIEYNWYIIGCEDMKYYINFSNFEEYVNVFKSKTEEFYELVLKVFKAIREVEWSGIGYEKTKDAIYNQIIELENIYETLNKFIDFFEMVNGNYIEGVKEVKQRFNQIEDMINEEKLKRGIL